MRSSSPSESTVGSQRTPPLAPPNGRLATAVLNVMLAASAVTSAASTAGWNRMPPLAGPRVVSWCTRQPANTSTVPSSMRTGTATSSTRRGRRSMRWMSASTPVSLAASSSRSRTACQGSAGSNSSRPPPFWSYSVKLLRFYAGEVVDVELLDDVEQTVPRRARLELDGDDVRVDVDVVPPAVLEEALGQHIGRTL